jgi:assimilatory nitrate reductase catalytic subunit
MTGRGGRLRADLRRLIGLDTAAERYAYTDDAVAGYVSAGKAADTWVMTTCGYCSVGCGMFIGVKEGRAVTVRGNPDHPVNRGMLCPKGLSEHHTIHAPNRAQFPMRRVDGRLRRITWDEALDSMTGASLVENQRSTNAGGKGARAPARAAATRIDSAQRRTSAS